MCSHVLGGIGIVIKELWLDPKFVISCHYWGRASHLSRQYGGDYSAESHTIKVDRAHNFFFRVLHCVNHKEGEILIWERRGGGSREEDTKEKSGEILRRGASHGLGITHYLYGYTHTHTYTYTYRLHRRSGGLAMEQTTTQVLCRGVGGGQQDLKGSSNVALAWHTRTHTHTHSYPLTSLRTSQTPTFFLSHTFKLQPHHLFGYQPETPGGIL